MRGPCSLEIWRLGALTLIVVLPFTYFFLQMRGPVLYKFGDLGALVLSSLPLVLSFSYFFLQIRGPCSLEIWRLGALTLIVVLPFTYFFLQMRGPCSLEIRRFGGPGSYLLYLLLLLFFFSPSLSAVWRCHSFGCSCKTLLYRTEMCSKRLVYRM